jgi:hypothetical protein
MVQPTSPARTPVVRRRRAAVGALMGAVALAALTLVATALPSWGATGTTTGTPPGQAWVRVAHLVPGLGAAQIEVVPADSAGGSSQAIQMSPEASYGDVTKYRQLTPQTYQVQVRMASATAASAPMLSRSLTLSTNDAYTLAVLGTDSAPRLAVLTDDLTPPAAHSARVRLLSASSQVSTVSVMAQNGPTIAENAVLGQASAYASVPAGVWHLAVSAPQVATFTSPVKVASGNVYTLLVLNGKNGSPQLKLVTDAAGASAAPKGGAQTGGGGTATQFVGPAPSTQPALRLGSALVVMIGLVAVGDRLGRRRLRRRAAR